jgi:hypothetical protein
MGSSGTLIPGHLSEGAKIVDVADSLRIER